MGKLYKLNAQNSFYSLLINQSVVGYR